MTATCPFCKRVVAVSTQIGGVKFGPILSAHGPSPTGSLFCPGSGKGVAK